MTQSSVTNKFHCKASTSFIIYKLFIYFLVLTVMLMLGACLAFILAAIAPEYNLSLNFQTIYLAIVILECLFLIICMFPWVFTRHIFTDANYTLHYNGFSKQTNTVPYDRINDIEIAQSFFGKLFGFAKVTFSMSDTSVSVIGISNRNADYIYNLIFAELIKNKTYMGKKL